MFTSGDPSFRRPSTETAKLSLSDIATSANLQSTFREVLEASIRVLKEQWPMSMDRAPGRLLGGIRAVQSCIVTVTLVLSLGSMFWKTLDATGSAAAASKDILDVHLQAMIRPMSRPPSKEGPAQYLRMYLTSSKQRQSPCSR
jgi:hypothetical protein